MAARYWVGGTATWDATAGTKWALTNGGAGGQAVPTSADDVFFTATSGAVTVTVSGSRSCNNLTCTGFTGTLTGTLTPILSFNGNVVISAGMALTLVKFIKSGTSSATFLSNGKTIPSFEVNGSGGVLTLSDALTVSSADLITVTAGTFTTNNYNVTATSLSSSNSNTRTINLGSSTVTLSGGGAVDFSTSTNLTFNPGTSVLVCSSPTATINSGGLAIYDAQYTSTTITGAVLDNISSARNITIAGRTTAAGVSTLVITANITITGTLTLSAGTIATMRTFVRSNTTGTTCTLTCAAVASLQDIDFRDITIAGAAAPVSGTRLGDCQGNSGIVFDAPKTVYRRNATSTLWESTTGWSLTVGGTADVTYFPLAQDTVVFPSAYPNSGVSISLSIPYNIGSIDLSARTTNTFTISNSSTTQIYGSLTIGTGVTIGGTSAMSFVGRTLQSITSAGKTFTFAIQTNCVGGTLRLEDAFASNSSSGSAISIARGTFDANGYNVTLSGAGSGVNLSASTDTRTAAIGSGTWTIAGTNGWNASTSAGLTVTGTGVINFTSAGKTFNGGGIQTYPTLNQGSTNLITIAGANKFANITNTLVGQINFPGSVTTEFEAFNLNGTSTAARLTIGSTTSSQAILKKPTAWNVGTGSLDGGNNTGLSFTAGTNDFLSISRINGVVSASGILVYISEAATSADTQSSLATFGGSVSESVAATDAPAARAVYLGLLSESAVSSEAAAAAQAYFASITESVIAADSLGTSFAFYAALAEQAVGSDRADPNLIMSSAVAEILAAADSVSGSRVLLSGISETASAQEANRIGLMFHPVIFESAQSTELSAVASSVFAVFALEAVQSSDGVNPAGSIYNAALPVEGATAADFLVATYLWNPIDDTQTANWQNVNSTQTPGWTQVNDEQTPVWVVIPTSRD